MREHIKYETPPLPPWVEVSSPLRGGVPFWAGPTPSMKSPEEEDLDLKEEDLDPEEEDPVLFLMGGGGGAGG